jgi:uncharacterized protein CbrC (UPF0167 family)
VTLPVFRYHPDPVASGSVMPSDRTCRSCGLARGHIYTGPVYAEEELTGAICPWCIADGSAHKKFDAVFVDSEGLDDDAPEEAIGEITERTPGFSSFQSERWPGCCGDAAAFVAPAGIAELRAEPGLEGEALSYIVYEMGISGGAATRLLQSLNRDKGPTAYLFRCLRCEKRLFHIDYV